jgi:hypothetical protein
MRTIIAFLLGALLFPAICFGAYKAEEMCFIPWGEGPNQLKIGEPHYEYDIIDTLGTIDSALWESGGPSDIMRDD